MAITVENINDFKTYFEGVMGRADHHADSVNEIILALVGGVVWRSNGNFKVREYNGAPANMLWLEVNGKSYCFNFNHSEGCIDVHEGSAKGPVIKTFDNSSPLSEVKSFFEKL